MNNGNNDGRKKESARNFYNIVEDAVEQIRRQREVKRERNNVLQAELKMDFEEKGKFEWNWIHELFVAFYSMISFWINNLRNNDSGHVLFLLRIIISVFVFLISLFVTYCA